MSMLSTYLSDDLAYAQELAQEVSNASEWLATSSDEYRERIKALKAADYDLDLLAKIDEYQEEMIKDVLHSITVAAYGRYEDLIAEGLDEDDAIEQADAESDQADHHGKFESTMDDAAEVLVAYLDLCEADLVAQNEIDQADDDNVHIYDMIRIREETYEDGLAEIKAMLA